MLEQEEEDQPDQSIVPPQDMRGGASLEQEDKRRDEDPPIESFQGGEHDDIDFEAGWLVEFRRAERRTIGLIWAGTLPEVRREAG